MTREKQTNAFPGPDPTPGEEKETLVGFRRVETRAVTGSLPRSNASRGAQPWVMEQSLPLLPGSSSVLFGTWLLLQPLS